MLKKGEISFFNMKNFPINYRNVLRWITILIFVILSLEIFKNQILSLIIIKYFDNLDLTSKIVKTLFSLISIFIFCLFIALPKRRIKPIYDDLFSLTIYSILLIYTLYRFDIIPHDRWYFTNLIWEIKYCDILYLYTVIRTVNCFKSNKVKQQEDKSTQDLCLSSDTAIKTIEQDKLEYSSDATDLIYRLLENKELYSKHALIIGLKGAWGTGKTSYLNLMIQALGKKENDSNAVIIKFNPWYSFTTNQIVTDFFNVLDEELETRIGTGYELKKDIIKYSNLIINSDSGWLSKFLSVFKTKDQSIEKQYEKISNKIESLNRTLFIFVDDIDRLDGTEILSVIQLMRNIANFKKTIFIVAYDEDYVLASIGDKINEPKAYLEKIFTIPHYLPNVRSEKLRDVAAETISTILFLKDSEKEKVGKFLNDINKEFTIRGAIRFANNISFIVPRLKEGDNLMIDIYDLLMLQYMQSIDINVYRALLNNRISDYNHYDSLLYDDSGQIGLNFHTSYPFLDNSKKLTEKEFIENRLKPIVLKEENISECFKILNLLFGANTQKSIYSIKASAAFNMYFERTISQNVISLDKFNNAFKESDELVVSFLKDCLITKNHFLLLRLLEQIKFEDQESGVRILKNCMTIFPSKWTRPLNDLMNDKKLIFLVGSDTISTDAILYSHNTNNKDYQTLYINTITSYILDLEKINEALLNKKFVLLLYVYPKYFDILFRNKYSFKDVYIKYLKRYFKLHSSYSDFNEDYWFALNHFYFGEKEELRVLLKEHIKSNIFDFIENYPIESLSNSYINELFYVHNVQGNSSNSIKTEWIDNFFKFIENMPKDIQESDMFKTYLTDVNTLRLTSMM